MFSRAKARYIKISVAVFAVTALLLSPALEQRIPKRAWRTIKRQWLVLTGGLVNVRGYRLGIECQGAGTPTVVFDSGLNIARQAWGVVPSEIAKLTRVCTYDRAGVGESDQAGFERTAADAVQELKLLLVDSGEQGPFLLVGHSFGGLTTRLFAGYYPNEVEGLVLVDPSHENQYGKLAALLPPAEREKYLRHEGGENNERMDILMSAEQARRIALRPDLPVVVVSADSDISIQDHSRRRIHQESQAATAALFPRSKHIVAPGTGHFVQTDDPETLLYSIREMIEPQSR